jgi:Lrp/AsnC family transcriptional regulator for asnA, asnC and gidA
LEIAMTSPFEQFFDELDVAILGHLEQDGRKSQSDIAADLGVTVSTIGNRLKRLRDEELLVIYGFLDPHRVGFNAPALIRVSAKPIDLEQLGAEIAELPEVLSVTLTTGEFQLLVEVQCRDNDHLTELIVYHLQQIEGIRETRTSILLREIMIKQPRVKMLFSTDQS